MQKRSAKLMILFAMLLAGFLIPQSALGDEACEMGCGLGKDTCHQNALDTRQICLNYAVDEWSNCYACAWGNVEDCARSCNDGQCDDFCWMDYYENIDSCNQFNIVESGECD